MSYECWEIAKQIRNFIGVKRKRAIGEFVSTLGISGLGDDAAIIDVQGDHYLLLATDGIWSRLMRNPWWAGYASVIVNVNDIVAMGGSVIAMVNVVSAGDSETRKEIARGMREAC